MRCFVHGDIEAVGTCKHCSKATCRTCARENQAGISCSDACEIQVSQYHEMTEKAKRLYGVGAGKKRVPSALFFNLIIGLGFFGFGAYFWYIHNVNGYSFFLIFLGALFAGFALYKFALDRTLPTF